MSWCQANEMLSLTFVHTGTVSIDSSCHLVRGVGIAAVQVLIALVSVVNPPPSFVILTAWSADAVLEPSLYWLYMTQMGFYLHCSYASIYIETIRKDFVVLMIHHILTLGLLLFSYLVR